MIAFNIDKCAHFISITPLFLHSNTKTNKTSDAIEFAKNDFQLHLRWTKWNVGNACNGKEYDQGRLK